MVFPAMAVVKLPASVVDNVVVTTEVLPVMSLDQPNVRFELVPTIDKSWYSVRSQSMHAYPPLDNENAIVDGFAACYYPINFRLLETYIWGPWKRCPQQWLTHSCKGVPTKGN